MNSRPKFEEAPGIRIRQRPGGRWEAFWRPRSDLAARGYPATAQRLWIGDSPTAVDRQWVSDRCGMLQAEMLVWGRGGIEDKRKPKRRIRSHNGFTYFITDGEIIKIGFSVDPKVRLLHLQTSTPRNLWIIGTILGDHERRLHQQFRHLRLNGEWFTATQELTDFIASALTEPFRGTEHADSPMLF